MQEEKKQQSGCERRGGEQHGQVGLQGSQQGGISRSENLYF